MLKGEISMRLLLCLIVILFCPMLPVHAVEHTHPTGDPKVNSESDRLLAMFYESQCQEEEAAYWYKRSLAHFPDNTLSRTYLEQMPAFLKEESIRFAAIARRTKNVNHYAFALQCDITNVALWKELEVLLQTQNLLKELK